MTSGTDSEYFAHQVPKPKSRECVKGVETSTDTGQVFRYDEGKTEYDLLPPFALEQIARVFTFGAKKYSRNGWRAGARWGRTYAAMMRHLQAFWSGEDLDVETSLPHLAHAGFSIMALLEFMVNHPEHDDRFRIDTKEQPWSLFLRDWNSSEKVVKG